MFIQDTVHSRYCSFKILFIQDDVHSRYCSFRIIAQDNFRQVTKIVWHSQCIASVYARFSTEVDKFVWTSKATHYSKIPYPIHSLGLLVKKTLTNYLVSKEFWLISKVCDLWQLVVFFTSAKTVVLFWNRGQPNFWIPAILRMWDYSRSWGDGGIIW
jgi:hypothetical protein